MPPVRTVKNQYRGINGHLHSYFQSEGGWHEFHTNALSEMLEDMRKQLIPRGYKVGMEESLQIRRLDDAALIGKPEADLMLYDADRLHSRTPMALQGAAMPLVQTLPEALGVRLEEPAPYRALAIRKGRGTPVTWIELLSPSNKPGGQDAQEYRDRRLQVLQSGLVFVEIDYLHESPPTYEGVKNYRAGEDGAHAYRIAVFDPRPKFMEGQGLSYEFDVDEPIPITRLPLADDDTFDFDFDKPYQRTVEDKLYGFELVDYGQLPLRFERYSVPDRMRIARRMLAVLRAFQMGLDLENAPLSVDNLPLATAQTELEALI